MPDGALDWMGVAHMLDVEGADERLAAAGPRRPLLRDDDLVLLGTGPEQCTAAERDAIAARDLRPIGVDDLRADPGAAARAALERATAGGRRFLVHFDVDLIDFSDVPLSENTGRGIGVRVRRGAGGPRRPGSRTTRCSASPSPSSTPTTGRRTAGTSRAWRRRWRGALARG